MRRLSFLGLLALGLVIGWGVNAWFSRDDGTDKSYLSFEQATKQSKFNLVRVNYAEFFNIGEKKRIGSWKALMVVGYQFQYGLDTANIELRKTSKPDVLPETWEVDVKKLELSSAELSSMKAFAVDKTWFNKYRDKIMASQEALLPRKQALGLQRLYGDPSKKIYNLLRESVQETLTNIAQAMDQNIVITQVNMPAIPKNWSKGLSFKVKYQLGDTTPIFDDRKRGPALKSAMPGIEGALPSELPELHTFEF